MGLKESRQVVQARQMHGASWDPYPPLANSALKFCCASD